MANPAKSGLILQIQNIDLLKSGCFKELKILCDIIIKQGISGRCFPRKSVDTSITANILNSHKDIYKYFQIYTNCEKSVDVLKQLNMEYQYTDYQSDIVLAENPEEIKIYYIIIDLFTFKGSLALVKSLQKLVFNQLNYTVMLLTPVVPLFPDQSIVPQSFNFLEGKDISADVIETFQFHFTEFQQGYTRVDQLERVEQVECDVGANLYVLSQTVLSGQAFRLGLYPKYGA